MKSVPTRNLAILTIFLLAFSALVRPASVFAQAPASAGAAIRVGVSPVFPPMVFKQGKELAGVEVDLAREFGKETGRPVTFVELPWEDQIEALSSGRIDIIMSSMSITAARQWVVDFSRPFLIVGQVALIRQEDQGKYLLGFPLTPPGPIGVLKATTGEFLVQREFPKTKFKVYKNESQAVDALAKKKINLFISDSTLIFYLAGTQSSKGLAAVPVALSQENVAWAVRKGDQKLLAEANEFLQKAEGSGKLKETLRRWMALPQ